jgi:hypothetical protein
VTPLVAETKYDVLMQNSVPVLNMLICNYLRLSQAMYRSMPILMKAEKYLK